MKNFKKIFLVFALIFCSISLTGCTKNIKEFVNYKTENELKEIKEKANSYLNEKYPGHEFTLNIIQSRSEFGYGHYIEAIDEKGVEFSVSNRYDKYFEDDYCLRYNMFHYSDDIIKYINNVSKRFLGTNSYIKEYKPYKYDTFIFYAGPGNDTLLVSPEKAIEAAKYCSFEATVEFNFDFENATDSDIEEFANSMENLILDIKKETSFKRIVIEDVNGCRFFYEEGYNDKTLKNNIKKEILKEK